MNPLRTPSRAALVGRLAQTNKWARAAILLELSALVALMLFGVEWGAVLHQPLSALLTVGIVASPTMLALGRILAQKKLALSNARPDRSIGNFTVAQIQALVRYTEECLNVKPGSVRVFITREKDLNASAIRVGLGRIFPSLNAIYLNRPVLHVLNSEELSAVIAHEIAHNERHFLLWQRYLVLHIGVQILAALALGAAIDTVIPFAADGIVGAILVGWGGNFISDWYRLRYSQTLEYLCDDAGAVVVGVEAAIQAELKVARRAEAHSKVMLHALRRKINDGAMLSAAEIFAELDHALPFEAIDHDSVTQELDTRLARIQRARSEFSVRGFLAFIGVLESSDERSQLREELDALELLHQIPTLKWRPEFVDTQKLVDALVADPETPLFQSRVDLSSEHATHPSARQRILYLWSNKVAIEAARTSVQSS